MQNPENMSSLSADSPISPEWTEKDIKYIMIAIANQMEKSDSTSVFKLRMWSNTLRILAESSPEFLELNRETVLAGLDFSFVKKSE